MGTSRHDATAPAPAPTRRLWRFLNEPREFDSSAIRVCCIVLAVAFGGITILRTLSSSAPVMP